MNTKVNTISCFDWQTFDDKVKGKQIVFTTDKKYRYLSGDFPSTIRKKLAKVFAASLVGISLVRIPSRVLFLLTGSWAIAGTEKAKKIWTQKCVECFRANRPNPHPLTRYRITFIAVFSELMKDTLKCATLPLASISLLFGSLWGMVNPYDGRRIIGKTEDLWSIEIPKRLDTRQVHFVTNYMARCMQDIETFKKRNLFRHFENYNPHTLRSLLLSLKNLDQEGLSHVENLKEKLKGWENWVKMQIATDEGEVNAAGGLRIATPKKRAIRKALINLLSVHENINRAIVAGEPVQDLQDKIRQAMAEVDKAFTESPASSQSSA